MAYFEPKNDLHFVVYCRNGQISTITKTNFENRIFCQQSTQSSYKSLTYLGFELFEAECHANDFPFTAFKSQLSDPKLCQRMQAIPVEHACELLSSLIPQFRQLSESSLEKMLAFARQNFETMINNKNMSHFDTQECRQLQRLHHAHFNIVFGTELATTSYFKCNQDRHDISNDQIIANNEIYLYDFMNYKKFKSMACNLRKNLCTTSDLACNLNELGQMDFE